MATTYDLQDAELQRCLRKYDWPLSWIPFLYESSFWWNDCYRSADFPTVLYDYAPPNSRLLTTLQDSSCPTGHICTNMVQWVRTCKKERIADVFDQLRPSLCRSTFGLVPYLSRLYDVAFEHATADRFLRLGRNPIDSIWMCFPTSWHHKLCSCRSPFWETPLPLSSHPHYHIWWVWAAFQEAVHRRLHIRNPCAIAMSIKLINRYLLSNRNLGSKICARIILAFKPTFSDLWNHKYIFQCCLGTSCCRISRKCYCISLRVPFCAFIFSVADFKFVSCYMGIADRGAVQYDKSLNEHWFLSANIEICIANAEW